MSINGVSLSSADRIVRSPSASVTGPWQPARAWVPIPTAAALSPVLPILRGFILIGSSSAGSVTDDDSAPLMADRRVMEYRPSSATMPRRFQAGSSHHRQRFLVHG
jgi:hypothetical protein